MAENDFLQDRTTPRLTSEYLDKSAVFRTERKSKLLVLVEDQDDVHFWERMFECVSPEYFQVRVCTLKSASAFGLAQLDAQGNPLVATGKDALMNVQHLGKYKVVAVDADFDLLIDYHTYSDRVRTDPYVIHTEYYSIENHLLTPETIQRLSLWGEVPAAPLPDWQEVSEVFGSAVSNPVKWVIASLDKREKAYRQDPSATNLPECIDVKDVHAVFAHINFDPVAYCECLAVAAEQMSVSYKSVAEEYADAMLPYSSWTPQDALHHIQGHTLYAFLSKAIEYYFTRGYKKLETERKSHVANQADIPAEIQKLKNELGVTSGIPSHIKEIIYRADALEMSDVALQKIQTKITNISATSHSIEGR